MSSDENTLLLGFTHDRTVHTSAVLREQSQREEKTGSVIGLAGDFMSRFSQPMKYKDRRSLAKQFDWS